MIIKNERFILLVYICDEYKIIQIKVHFVGKLQDEYKQLCEKIEDASSQEAEACDFTGDFAVFSNIERKNHPTIIKVFLYLLISLYFILFFLGHEF